MNFQNVFGPSRLRRTFAVLLLPLGLLSTAGAAQAACTGQSGNKAAINSSVNNSVNEGGLVTLSTAPSAKGLTFDWAYISGPSVTPSPASGTSTSFTAPHVTSGHSGVLVIRQTATGCVGPADTADISINITNLSNAAPIAVAGASAATVSAGTQVFLSSAGSYDPDNDPISYAWTQLPGSPAVTILGANTASASFVAPVVSSTTTFSFRLTVTETLSPNLPGTATVTVNVLVANQPPVASISCPASVDEGGTITLDGSASSDPDNDALTYSWEQRSGFPVAVLPPPPYGNSISFTAPSLGYLQTGEVAFGLTVTDTGGASDSTSDAECTLFINDVTAPVLSGGGDQTLEATSPAGAVATYEVSANDNVDGASIATCIPPSGSDFPLGATPVACAQSDSSGNIGELGFTITVQDTTPPVIDAHGDETAEATSPAGAIVDYAAPATSDAYDGPGVASCAPPSGSQFALGTTTVTCDATDTNGNAATSTSFDVVVADTIAPDITAPANVVAEATGPLTTVAYDQATATDAVGPVTIESDAPAQFPLGETVITWTATDGAMNVSIAQSKVTVVDTTPPSISAHADVNVLATSAAGAVATYVLPTATDLVDGSVPVTCAPVSGSSFAIGSTVVNCSASDNQGNTAYSSFKVIVSYNFAGFFKPIDNLPVVNVVKAGQAIPVKFSLGGDMGLGIMAAGYPRSLAMVCAGGVQDAVEETVTAGGSSLSYDPTTGQYIYVWKSEKAWAGTCRQLQVKLADGSVHYANFSFTR